MCVWASTMKSLPGLRLTLISLAAAGSYASAGVTSKKRMPVMLLTASMAAGRAEAEARKVRRDSPALVALASRCSLMRGPRCPPRKNPRPSDERAGDDRETGRDLHRHPRPAARRRAAQDEPALALPGGEHEAIVRLRTGSARAAVLRPAEARQRQPDAHTECQRQNGTTAGPGDRRGPSW